MASVSTAATITISRGIGNAGIVAQNPASAGGALLATGGYYIAAGTFTNGSGVTQEPIITTEFSSLLAAVASFDVFGSSTSPTSGTTLGTISAGITALGGSDTSVFNTKEIYILVGNGATQAASTAFGIFKMTTPVFFPANVAAAGSTTVPTSSTAAITPLANAGSEPTPGTFQLATAVPEPSAALLGAIGALGLLRRRRI